MEVFDAKDERVGTLEGSGNGYIAYRVAASAWAKSTASHSAGQRSRPVDMQAVQETENVSDTVRREEVVVDSEGLGADEVSLDQSRPAQQQTAATAEEVARHVPPQLLALLDCQTTWPVFKWCIGG